MPARTETEPNAPAMNEGRQTDPVLRPVLEASSDEERKRAIAELLAAEAYGLIEKVLAGRFGKARISSEHLDDVRHDIILRLIHRLNRLHASGDVILRFADYVAAISYNVFGDFVRRAFPLRSRLRNKIRYVLMNDSRLAAWDHGGYPVCGLAIWNGAPADASFEPRATTVHYSGDLAEALHRLFLNVQTPLALDDVVSVLAVASGIPADETPVPLADAPPIAVAGPAAALERTEYLHDLWREVRELPLPQRFALLLHARDANGESVTALLPLANVASMTDISGALELPPDQFAELWRDLPLDDKTIAEILGVTRQQVINLRQAARHRLLRRLEHPRRSK